MRLQSKHLWLQWMRGQWRIQMRPVVTEQPQVLDSGIWQAVDHVVCCAPSLYDRIFCPLSFWSWMFSQQEDWCPHQDYTLLLLYYLDLCRCLCCVSGRLLMMLFYLEQVISSPRLISLFVIQNKILLFFIELFKNETNSHMRMQLKALVESNKVHLL